MRLDFNLKIQRINPDNGLWETVEALNRPYTREGWFGFKFEEPMKDWVTRVHKTALKYYEEGNTDVRAYYNNCTFWYNGRYIQPLDLYD